MKNKPPVLALWGLRGRLSSISWEQAGAGRNGEHVHVVGGLVALLGFLFIKSPKKNLYLGQKNSLADVGIDGLPAQTQFLSDPGHFDA